MRACPFAAKPLLLAKATFASIMAIAEALLQHSPYGQNGKCHYRGDKHDGRWCDSQFLKHLSPKSDKRRLPSSEGRGWALRSTGIFLFVNWRCDINAAPARFNVNLCGCGLGFWRDYAPLLGALVFRRGPEKQEQKERQHCKGHNGPVIEHYLSCGQTA